MRMLAKTAELDAALNCARTGITTFLTSQGDSMNRDAYILPPLHLPVYMTGYFPVLQRNRPQCDIPNVGLNKTLCAISGASNECKK